MYFALAQGRFCWNWPGGTAKRDRKSPGSMAVLPLSLVLTPTKTLRVVYAPNKLHRAEAIGFLGVQSAPFPIRKETARSSGRKVSIDIQPGLLTHSLSVSACETVRRRSYELEINSSCSFFTARFARKRDFRHRWRRRFHLHNWHAPVSSAATPHSGPPPQVSSDFRNLELWRFTFQIPPVGEVVKQQSLSLIRPYVLKCICIY